jgi:hypothetical protein
MDDLNIENLSADTNNQVEKDHVEGEGDLLDLYYCCHCSFYCVASGVIPGVIPRRLFDEFVRDRRDNPPPGKSGELALNLAVETIIKYVQTSHPLQCIYSTFFAEFWRTNSGKAKIGISLSTAALLKINWGMA